VTVGPATDVPALDDLAERAAAAVSGDLRKESLADVTRDLTSGIAAITRWAPRLSVFQMTFRLKQRTGVALHPDGSVTWRSRWCPEDEAHSEVVLRTDGGVGAYLEETPGLQRVGSIYHLDDDDLRRVIAAQPEVDRWWNRAERTEATDQLLAAYLADREAWLTLARDETRVAVYALFSAAGPLAGPPDASAAAPVCRYLAAAYLRFDQGQRDTLAVLVDDGWAILPAIATARSL
jgi:hypothetical protein